MKEDTKEVGENETCSSDRREFEKEFINENHFLNIPGIFGPSFYHTQVTSADQVSIRTSENIKKDEGDSRSMRAESKIGKDGGALGIQNTRVSLQIPPGALQRDYFVQMRIIPHHYLDETELSFASNSSVVVELLPNNVKLSKPATLTLPHCLVLKKKCGWKAKVYSSHHKEGNQPQWEEEQNAQCDVTYETCVMQFYNFSWKKVQIGDDKVEAKRIMLYAAMRSSIENEIFLDIGYYWQLPSCRDVSKFK
ncbi:putative netrin receptor UNC5B isoform X1 [Apostichopus japonicus]|uniref:Putative netrin receptor UNC5B isoform X1 n=1 Tax=Stichopus japonicus TaxID=307972 RepID=A0A2G8JVH9_STIJA|nr:putative netrin receptor UNC5B isoform X1 [Apostichopus japonicus]